MDGTLAREIANTLREVTQNQAKASAAVVETKKKSEEGKALDEQQVAALKGFCGVTSAGDCPAIWAIFKQCKNIQSARSHLMRGMEQWGASTGNELTTNILFSEEQMKDIMSVNPNPTETTGTAEASDRGVSNLICLPRTAKEIEQRKLQEQARDGCELTYKEKWALTSGKNTRNPPQGYYTLRLMVATTCSLLYTLYGRKCDLYLKFLEILNILKEKPVKEQSAGFTALKCRTYTWAMYDDCRTFFCQRLLPQDFNTPRVKFPYSLLPDIYSNIRFVNEVQRANFPIAWDDKDNEGGKQPGKNTQSGGGGGGNSGGVSGDRSGGGAEYQVPTLPPNSGSTTTQDLAHLHPKIRAAMKPLHDKYKGKVLIQEVMENANLWWNDLPKHEPTINKITGQDEICWNFVTGKCKFGPRCAFVANHVPGKALPDSFAEELVNKLQPGINKMLAADYDRNERYRKRAFGGEAGGGPPKRPR
jgi:hypothetical protein